MKQLASVIFLLAVLYSTFFLSPGCANMIPPTGGSRDSIPPVLINATPPDSALRFNAKRITLSFDEFIRVENPGQALIVSPFPAQPPLVEGRLRSVVITLRDSLEPNTTYTLDFGNAIRDNNESNILRDFSYTFSTGNSLDSNSLSGSVLIAESGKVDSTMFVLLHRNLADSAVSKERPRYVARVNSDGSFQFQNLPPGTFALYALKDESGMRRYLSPTTLFAFNDEPVDIPYRGTALELRAFIDSIPEPEAPARTTPAATGGNGREGRVVPRMQLGNNLDNGTTQSLLDSLRITVNGAPLKTFDSSKIVLYSETYVPAPGHRVHLDTSRKVITVANRWVENTTYNLVIDRDFAEDTAGLKIPSTDTITFKTRRTNEYGAVQLRFLNLDLSLNPLLQLVQQEKVVHTIPLSSRVFSAELFEPGEYGLRIVLDANKNGKWDSGMFRNGIRRQPERVIFIERKVNVKANWDNDVDITL